MVFKATITTAGATKTSMLEIILEAKPPTRGKVPKPAEPVIKSAIEAIRNGVVSFSVMLRKPIISPNNTSNAATQPPASANSPTNTAIVIPRRKA